ncbi:hypothetical protein [Paraferrimonas sp. SM1919]|uniref:alpha/beta hydrolase family protein n=1 Tax=Paraferrimonas sp. SM1919 TaxID=2662263 RepID=UPI0013D6FB2D|nr:hypothetical protein [Paraferrimonas sp. SM1919]
MKIFNAAVVGLSIAVSACSSPEVELPAVPELQMSTFELSNLYGATAPNLDVIDYGEESESSLEAPFRLLAVETKQALPLLVFSHGMWASQTRYDNLLMHWAKQGYAVLSINHVDCCSMAKGIFNSLRYGNLGLIQKRDQDIAALLNLAPEITNRHGVTIDTTNVAIVGHSFGAFSAQMIAGARAKSDQGWYQFDTGLLSGEIGMEDIKAIVAVSPPGPMFDEITSESWDGINKPMLVTTGTWDVEPRFFPQYQLHQMSYDKAPKGDKYTLVVAGADHYYGNLICRPEREQAPQTKQFEILKSITTAFLDTYLKGIEDASYAIEAGAIDEATAGFATLISK